MLLNAKNVMKIKVELFLTLKQIIKLKILNTTPRIEISRAIMLNTLDTRFIVEYIFFSFNVFKSFFFNKFFLVQ